MALIECAREGATWQADFEPHISRLSAYFGRCFARDHDIVEKRQDALCQFMDTFRRQWSKGQPFGISLTYAAAKARTGRTFGSVPREQPKPSVRLGHTGRIMLGAEAAHVRPFSAYRMCDLWSDVARIGERYVRCLRLIYDGHSPGHRNGAGGMSRTTFRSARRAARAVLASGS